MQSLMEQLENAHKQLEMKGPSMTKTTDVLIVTEVKSQYPVRYTTFLYIIFYNLCDFKLIDGDSSVWSETERRLRIASISIYR